MTKLQIATALSFLYIMVVQKVFNGKMPTSKRWSHVERVNHIVNEVHDEKDAHRLCDVIERGLDEIGGRKRGWGVYCIHRRVKYATARSTAVVDPTREIRVVARSFDVWVLLD